MENMELKPLKGIDEWSRKQFKSNHFVYYRRKGVYAECHCAECGQKYVLRAIPTEDPFVDAATDIEKPERDKETVCRKCGAKAVYKPAKHTKSEYAFERVCYGQKIDDEHFVFRIFYATQKTRQGQDTYYGCTEDERIYLEKGKKPSRYDHYAYYADAAWHNPGTWHQRTTGENWYYLVHPKTRKEIAKTGMFKYVPVMDHWKNDGDIIEYYIAAARYPDLEMIIKMGMTDYADNLIRKIPVNPNPRGKKIEDRLRINKDRLKSLIEHKGEKRTLELYQLERRLGAHWKDKELSIVRELREPTYTTDWEKVSKILKYMSPIRMKNYMKKQKMWMPGKSATWQERKRREDLRREYYDYILMRIYEGYDMTSDIILFPADFVRRRDEMIMQVEKAKMDKRKKEVLEKFPKIKSKYRRLSEKYYMAEGGYVIRPAKDAAEIVEEGRILHHCVGGDGYLNSHDNGKSFILFLRAAAKKDVPFITVEIRGEEIVQWYGAYDKKPDRKSIDAWLNTYTEQLTRREKEGKVKNTKAFEQKGAA